jgi:hypothetical protein
MFHPSMMWQHHNLHLPVGKVQGRQFMKPLWHVLYQCILIYRINKRMNEWMNEWMNELVAEDVEIKWNSCYITCSCWHFIQEWYNRLVTCEPSSSDGRKQKFVLCRRKNFWNLPYFSLLTAENFPKCETRLIKQHIIVT